MPSRRHPYRIIVPAGLLLALLLALVSTQAALAHARIEVGPYVIIIGWRSEPPIVGERNALLFEISEDGQPVEGVEATLNVVVSYAGRTFTGNLNPTATPGQYTVEIFPTVRGQYQVLLSGAVGETAVDVTGEPEEVLPAAALQFPEALPDTLAMQETLDELTGQLRTTRLLSISGLVGALLGLGAAVLAFLRSKR
jgi:hypothetical protein